MMTHDEMIAVIAAHRDGKKIQFRRRRVRGSTWSKVIEPVWNFDENDYRTEPEPIEVWVVVSCNNKAVGSFIDKKHAESVAVNFKDSRVVRMIEAEKEKDD